jgi:hypothetical protein
MLLIFELSIRLRPVNMFLIFKSKFLCKYIEMRIVYGSPYYHGSPAMG